MDQHVYNEYLAILREEIRSRAGLHRAIAIAYASAKARRVLGRLPEHITVKCSGNIIKNVKAVIVPTTGDMKASKPAPCSARSAATPTRSSRCWSA